MDNQKFIDRLRAARARVAAGWVSGTSQEGKRVCAARALELAGIWGRAYRLRMPNGDDMTWDKIIDWNDAKGRRKAEVVAMFDNSIAALSR